MNRSKIIIHYVNLSCESIENCHAFLLTNVLLSFKFAQREKHAKNQMQRQRTFMRFILWVQPHISSNVWVYFKIIYHGMDMIIHWAFLYKNECNPQLARILVNFTHASHHPLHHTLFAWWMSFYDITSVNSTALLL